MWSPIRNKCARSKVGAMWRCPLCPDCQYAKGARLERHITTRHLAKLGLHPVRNFLSTAKALFNDMNLALWDWLACGQVPGATRVLDRPLRRAVALVRDWNQSTPAPHRSSVRYRRR